MKIPTLLVSASISMAAIPANAAFHLFDIREVYSNGNGSVQFIELFSAVGSQQFVSGQTLRLEQVSPVLTLGTFTFAANGPAPTDNKTYLIGTANLGPIYGVTPDFVLPAGFLSLVGGFSNKRINFAGGNDILNLGSLPLDGVMSLDGLVNNSTATAFAINTQASPTNYAGQTALIPEPGSAALVTLGALALGGTVFTRRRRR